MLASWMDLPAAKLQDRPHRIEGGDHALGSPPRVHFAATAASLGTSSSRLNAMEIHHVGGRQWAAESICMNCRPSGRAL